MTLADWLARHTTAAPPALRGRVRQHALNAPTDGPVPERLARAGSRALERVVAHPGDRSVALDLLAADALITLALLAQAEVAPAELDAFATSLLKAARPGT
ncbi:MAG TPA: hypothetical protein VJQ46_06150 [Gemmatimonadales bacterium]|nr:hypothetical protein [Gemmatimonadales bacterium]